MPAYIVTYDINNSRDPNDADSVRNKLRDDLYNNIQNSSLRISNSVRFSESTYGIFSRFSIYSLRNNINKILSSGSNITHKNSTVTILKCKCITNYSVINDLNGDIENWLDDYIN